MNNFNELTATDARCEWPNAEPYLRRAIYGANPDTYLRNVQARIFAGINTLWKIGEGERQAYVVTTIYTVDGLNSIAQIHLMTADDMNDVIPLMDYFTVWAKKRGADWIEVIGRKGWERALKPYGFKHEYTSIMKPVIKEIH